MLGTAWAQQATNQNSEPAGIAAEVMKATATVESINYGDRQVTLKTPDGMTETFKVGKEARNFDQVKVGDQVNMTYLESFVVYVQKAGGPPAGGAATVMVRAPKGAMPGGVVANTIDLKAKIDAVDPQKHTVTVTGALGHMRTMHVDPKVNLADLKPGDDVTVRYTEAFAINVERPSSMTTPEANAPPMK
jgi:Cu/Ag efflux protein CusF